MPLEDLANLKKRKEENQKKDSTLSGKIAWQAVSSSPEYINQIIFSLRDVCKKYQSGEVNKGHEEFCHAVELIDLYTKLNGLILKTYTRIIPQFDLDKEMIAEQELRLLSILKAVLNAKERQDLANLCDLLEYELIDNLTMWKVKVIPELKRAKEELKLS